MKKQVVILGGGVGGTLVANLLAKKLKAHEADIIVIDRTGDHVYQPGFLYVPFGWEEPANLARPEESLLYPRVKLVRDTVAVVDVKSRRVATEKHGEIPYDFLVLATGSHVHPEEVPGLKEASHHFYTATAAMQLRAALEKFKGGRVVVGVAGVPYKCPPAPLEFAFMFDWVLRQKGIRQKTELHYISPLPRVFPIESVAAVTAPMLEERGYHIHTFFNVESVDPAKKELVSLEGETIPFDLLVLVPPHRGADVVTRSGLAESGGWVPTDRHTLKVEGPDGIYAIGDATNLPISKSGAAAHFEGEIVAGNIVQELRGEKPSHQYNGHVMCFLESGNNRATILNFDYEHPPKPPTPSVLWHMGKLVMNKSYWYMVPKGRLPG